MIQEGFELMVIGMGVVFAFLVLLVVCMTCSGMFFQRFSHLFREESPVEPPNGSPPRPPAALAAAVAAARRARQ